MKLKNLFSAMLTALVCFAVNLPAFEPISLSFYDWTGSAMRPNTKIDVRLTLVNKFTNAALGSFSQESTVMTNSFGLFSAKMDNAAWTAGTLANIGGNLNNAAIKIETKKYGTADAYRMIGVTALSSLVKDMETAKSGETTALNLPSTQKIALLQWYDANSTNIEYTVQSNPWETCFDGQYVWVSNYGSNSVSRINTSTGSVDNYSSVGNISTPRGICFDGAYIWVANNTASGTVTKINPNTGAVVGTPVAVGNNPIGICFDGEYIWTANRGSNSVSRINAKTSAVAGTYALAAGAGTHSICFGNGRIWVTNESDNTVSRIDTNTGAVVGTPVVVGNRPLGICYDGKYIWTANYNANSVSKIDAGTGNLIGNYTVGNGPFAIAFDGEYIWVTNSTANTVSKLKASDGSILNTYSTAGSPQGICFDGINMWITLRGSAKVIKM